MWNPLGNEDKQPQQPAPWWRPSDFANGVEITILPDHQQYLELPETLDLSAHPETDKTRAARGMRAMWDKARAKRSYEHEIMVIAPADELTIDGEPLD